jgi:integrase
VRLEFGKLLTDLKLKHVGLGFYGLRHSFRTVADATRDAVAVDVVMGHSDPSMGARYRERIEDDRLEEVARVVRTWLFQE